MCKFEKNLNRVYTLSGIILLIIVVMAISSCGSNKLNCNKTKFKHNMSQWYYQPHIDCENCDEID